MSATEYERTPAIAEKGYETPLAHDLEAIWESKPGIRGFMSSVDHKEIGIRYLVTSFVFLVLGGEGTVDVGLGGDPGYHRTVTVTGSPTLYTLYDAGARDDVLRLSLSPGVQAYAFTFG